MLWKSISISLPGSRRDWSGLLAMAWNVLYNCVIIHLPVPTGNIFLNYMLWHLLSKPYHKMPPCLMEMLFLDPVHKAHSQQNSAHHTECDSPFVFLGLWRPRRPQDSIICNKCFLTEEWFMNAWKYPRVKREPWSRDTHLSDKWPDMMLPISIPAMNENLAIDFSDWDWHTRSHWKGRTSLHQSFTATYDSSVEIKSKQLKWLSSFFISGAPFLSGSSFLH